jgi:hypothetical protein
MENSKELQPEEVVKGDGKKEETGKKKVSLSDFKVKSFVTQVKVDQMQFLKTAGG